MHTCIYCNIVQYRMCPPFALITFVMRFGIESDSFSHGFHQKTISCSNRQPSIFGTFGTMSAFSSSSLWLATVFAVVFWLFVHPLEVVVVARSTKQCERQHHPILSLDHHLSFLDAAYSSVIPLHHLVLWSSIDRISLFSLDILSQYLVSGE